MRACLTTGCARFFFATFHFYRERKKWLKTVSLKSHKQIASKIMASSTGFAALAETSRDAALAFVAQQEQVAELRAELAQLQNEKRFNAHQWNLRDIIEQAQAQEHLRVSAELAATRAELAEVRLELAGARAAAVPVPE